MASVTHTHAHAQTTHLHLPSRSPHTTSSPFCCSYALRPQNLRSRAIIWQSKHDTVTVGCRDNEPYTRDEHKGVNPSLQPSSTELIPLKSTAISAKFILYLSRDKLLLGIKIFMGLNKLSLRGSGVRLSWRRGCWTAGAGLATVQKLVFVLVLVLV